METPSGGTFLVGLPAGNCIFFTHFVDTETIFLPNF